MARPKNNNPSKHHSLYLTDDEERAAKKQAANRSLQLSRYFRVLLAEDVERSKRRNKHETEQPE